MNGNIRLGISRCLLGENVRYDGGHKLDVDLRDALARIAAFVPVCPEVECGLVGVTVYQANGGVTQTGVGIFARMFAERFALVPREDEARLRGPALRENFIERLAAFKRGLPTRRI